MKTLIRRLDRRKKRVSANISGSAEKPRISIFRSNKYIFAQVVDDATEKTLLSVHSKTFEKNNVKKTEASRLAGVELAKQLKSKNIETAVIDRNRFNYLGRVTGFVTGLREGGLKV